MTKDPDQSLKDICKELGIIWVDRLGIVQILLDRQLDKGIMIDKMRRDL